MAQRASPDRFQALVKRAYKDHPDQVRLVRIVDGDEEECDQAEITKRPGRYELHRVGGEMISWTDSSVDDVSDGSGSARDKAIARDLERQGMTWALAVSSSQRDNDRLYTRCEKLELELEAARKENARLSDCLATEVAGGGVESEALQIAAEIATRLIDRQFMNELHQRFNNCKSIMSAGEARRIIEIINSEEFTKRLQGTETEPPATTPKRLDA